MTENDTKEKDKSKILRNIQFINGSIYEGTWDAINKIDIGRYITSYKVILEGEFRDGMFHGCGSMYWPRGQIIDAVWNRGHIERKRYTFADGLLYREDNWDYCKFPDRRFYNCIVNGLRPAGKTLKTNTQPTKIIPPFCYDTGAGIFDPDNNCIISYRNHRKILKIPTKLEIAWIKKNNRKNCLQPTGYQDWLHEYWQSEAADFTKLSHTLPEHNTKNWWQRLTRFSGFVHWHDR